MDAPLNFTLQAYASGSPDMNLDFSAEDNAFRLEARTFIAENYPKALREKQDRGETLSKEDYLSWHRILAKKGWSTPSWPKELGGTDWTPTQKYIWSEEQALADTIGILPFGVAMLAPVLYTFGTPEQKAKFLPDIREGKIWWCQGYSEPGAGSDLASLKTASPQTTARNTIWSMARRRGPPLDSMLTGASSWSAPIPTPSRNRASASCSST